MSDRPAELSSVKAARREKIVDTAERLFSHQGFRATTMEGIAAAVGMSKVTVYGYFRDKDVLFEAMAQRLAKRILAEVETQLASQGSLAERLTRALSSKHQLVFELVRQSAFSSELFAAKDRFATAIFRDLDQRIETLLIQALQSDGRTKKDAVSAGRILFAGSTGIANHATSSAQMHSDIGALVQAITR